MLYIIHISLYSSFCIKKSGDEADECERDQRGARTKLSF